MYVVQSPDVSVTSADRKLLEPGHFCSACDQYLEIIEKKKGRVKKFWTAQELRILVQKSSQKFTVIHMHQEQFVANDAITKISDLLEVI